MALLFKYGFFCIFVLPCCDSVCIFCADIILMGSFLILLSRFDVNGHGGGHGDHGDHHHGDSGVFDFTEVIILQVQTIFL